MHLRNDILSLLAQAYHGPRSPDGVAYGPSLRFKSVWGGWRWEEGWRFVWILNVGGDRYALVAVDRYAVDHSVSRVPGEPEVHTSRVTS